MLSERRMTRVWCWSPQQGSRTVLLLEGFEVKPPPLWKLDIFTYLTVNFVCIFAHKRYKYADKSVCLLHPHPLVGVHQHHPHPLHLYLPWVRLYYTLSVTVLCVFIATVFAVDSQLGKLPWYCRAGYKTLRQNVTDFLLLMSSFSSVQIW